jgi:acyl carrier protein
MSRALTIVVLALAVAFVGCGPTAQPDLVEKVRLEVAKSLKKDAAQINVGKPLGVQGADELDVVEIVMAVEDAFKVEIPDSAVGEKLDEIAKTLTIQKLADIVAGQLEKQKR